MSARPLLLALILSLATPAAAAFTYQCGPGATIAPADAGPMEPSDAQRAELIRRAKTALDDRPADMTLGELDGWIAAIEAVSAGDPVLHVRRWLDRHPHHPAQAYMAPLVGETADTAAAAAGPPARIGALLPLSGPFAEAGRSIAAGLRQELEALAPSSTLEVFDTHPSLTGTVAELRRWQPQVVIGPLTKDDATNYVAAGPPAPSLVLNELPGPPPPDVSYFGLLPEHEGRSAADWLRGEGARCGALIAIDDETGVRTGHAFLDAWAPHSHCPTDAEFFPAAEAVSSSVARLLGVRGSEERKARLQRMIGESVEYIPRRRQDLDFIVIDMPSDAAIRVIPLLRYWFADDIPVLGTSRIDDGLINPDHAEDLDGTFILEPPAEFASVGGALPLLEAFGRDAARVVVQTGGMARRGGMLEGLSGRWLWLGSDGRVERRLLRAELTAHGKMPWCEGSDAPP